ncbi:hypothetical protein SAMN04488513_1225, partial [Pseudozobellia thermophila]
KGIGNQHYLIIAFGPQTIKFGNRSNGITDGKTLKAVTEYIIEKYVPIHQLKEDSFLE